MSQTKAQLLDNIKDNVQLDARNSLRFADTDSSHYVAFKAPATISSNVTWTLPAADGSANYVLATDGSGNLSWIADPAGQWITTGSHVYFSAGNVGIGDSSPSNPLSVTGASAFNGDVTFTGASYNVTWDKSADDLIFNDNAKAAFGTSSDLEIYHNGSHSYIKDAGTGNLSLMSGGAAIVLEKDNAEPMLVAHTDGAVELYFDNSKKIETSSSGVKMPDSAQFELGDGSDLKMWHSGSHSFIRNETGNLTIEANGAGDDALKIVPDGAVELYFDNTKRFETSTEGVETQGELHFKAPSSATGEQVGRLEWWNENDAGVMAKIAVDRTAGALAPGDLVFSTSANVDTTANGGDGDITERLRITSAGDINIPVDGDKLQLGASQDLQLFHDGTHNNIKSTNGELHIKDADDGYWIRNEVNGPVSLYYDGSQKFSTVSAGVEIHGNAQFDDNCIAKFGTGGDLEIFHDGGDTYIRQSGVGALSLEGSSYIDVRHTSAGTDPVLRLVNEANTTAGAFNVIRSLHDNRTCAEIRMGRNNDNSDFSAAAGATQGDIQFYTTASGTLTQRARFNNTGYFHADADSGSFVSCDSNLHAFRSSTSNWALRAINSHASTPYGIHSFFNNSHPDDETSRFFAGQDDQTSRILIYSNGDIENHDGSYGQTSDIKLKENIVDANSQWDDIKAVRVRNFNFKISPAKKQIGVVAQELETVSPGLVSTHKDLDEDLNDLGTTTKSVKSSILYMKAIKALQEAMAKIETLETKVAALESA